MDFPIKNIIITKDTDNWGPYKFKFPIISSVEGTNGVLPYNTQIQAVETKIYYEDLLVEDIEIVDSDYSPVFGADYVGIRFCYPGDDYLNKKFTLVFLITLSNEGIRPFEFGYITIR